MVSIITIVTGLPLTRFLVTASLRDNSKIQYLQYGANLQRIHKIVINLVHTLFLYKESQEKDHAIKLSTSITKNLSSKKFVFK